MWRVSTKLSTKIVAKHKYNVCTQLLVLRRLYLDVLYKKLSTITGHNVFQTIADITIAILF